MCFARGSTQVLVMLQVGSDVLMRRRPQIAECSSLVHDDIVFYVTHYQKEDQKCLIVACYNKALLSKSYERSLNDFVQAVPFL